MQTRDRFFDDAARLGSGVVGLIAGLKREVDTLVRGQIDRIAAEMDLVPREEFEAVRAMAVKAREAEEALAERVERLEARLAALEGRASSTG